MVRKEEMTVTLEFSGDEFGVLNSDDDEYTNEYLGGGGGKAQGSSSKKSTPGQC